jgi:hypothetical protein
LTIQGLAGQIEKIQIWSLTGILQKEHTILMSQVNNLDLEQLKTGTYFLRFISKDGQVFTKKILKI